MKRAAVLGTGQTEHRTKRLDVSMAGLCREAIDRALADAGVDWPQIDAVVLGKAPDLFEGVMMPELFLADAIGADPRGYDDPQRKVDQHDADQKKCRNQQRNYVHD